MNFMLRHPLFTIMNVKRSWAVHKAMKVYAKDHPVCEATGVTKMDGTHIIVEVEHSKNRYEIEASEPVKPGDVVSVTIHGTVKKAGKGDFRLGTVIGVLAPLGTLFVWDEHELEA